MSNKPMSNTNRLRSGGRHLGVAALFAGAVVTLAACGTEQESGASGTASSTPAYTSSTGASSVPVVGGPDPRSKTRTSSAEASSSSQGGTTCGTISGPDGSLRILVLAGDVDCTTAKKIGGEYSPKIATGTAQQVSGWTCGPSQVEGILAACQSGDKVIGFTP